MMDKRYEHKPISLYIHKDVMDEDDIGVFRYMINTNSLLTKQMRNKRYRKRYSVKCPACGKCEATQHHIINKCRELASIRNKKMENLKHQY